MKQDTLRQLANLLAALVALAVNVLAVTLPLNGKNTAEISNLFPVYFVPAGYVFSIWGIIYIGWIAFVIFQFLPGQAASPRLRSLGYLFALSCLLNAGWLFCWHYEEFGLSVVVMLALLVSLIASYLRLNVGRIKVSARERWSVDIPFSVYLGWITVATVANTSDYLYYVGWNGFGIAAQAWGVIMLAVASLLGLAMAVTRRDAGYLFVLVWAFIGIAIKQSGAALVTPGAWLAALFALALAVWSLVQRARPGAPKPAG
jgi:benzodiazapine receptor